MKKISFFLVMLILGLGIASVAYTYDGGYEAGRQWAKANGVIDDDYHSDHSEDFDNGVRQYAVEQQQLQNQTE